MPTGPLLYPYQILSYYHEQYGSYCLHKISASGEITTQRRKSVVSLARDTPTSLFIPTKYYQTMSKGIKVIELTRMSTISASGEMHNELSESCLSCTRHAYRSSSSSLPDIIKLSQQKWVLWPVQDISFRGDNYITLVSLAHDMPNNECLIPTKYYQNIFKGIKVMERTRMSLQFLLQGR